MKNTIEEIENDYWGEPDVDDTGLVKICLRLRKKNINDLTIEDLRIMIGQNIALPIVAPIAINKLKENIFAEGNMYEGDLLLNVLQSNKEFWEKKQGTKKRNDFCCKKKSW